MIVCALRPAHWWTSFREAERQIIWNLCAHTHTHTHTMSPVTSPHSSRSTRWDHWSWAQISADAVVIQNARTQGQFHLLFSLQVFPLSAPWNALFFTATPPTSKSSSKVRIVCVKTVNRLQLFPHGYPCKWTPKFTPRAMHREWASHSTDSHLPHSKAGNDRPITEKPWTSLRPTSAEWYVALFHQTGSTTENTLSFWPRTNGEVYWVSQTGRRPVDTVSWTWVSWVAWTTPSTWKARHISTFCGNRAPTQPSFSDYDHCSPENRKSLAFFPKAEKLLPPAGNTHSCERLEYSSMITSRCRCWCKGRGRRKKLFSLLIISSLCVCLYIHSIIHYQITVEA